MRPVFLIFWALLALVAFVGFVSLGTWQVERRAWKHDLIERVEARLAAPPVAAPGRAEWPALEANPDDYEYRRVTLAGELLHPQSSLVQASSVLGGGYWVLTPLRMADDTVVMINRGFVPRLQGDGAWRQALPEQEATTVTGLLRPSEPDGGFLRDNDPAAGLWYSRDVARIAASHGLANVAPYFIDADSDTPLPAEWTLEPPPRLPDEALPVAGLTVVSFHDKHLVYALTWYGLALMVAAAAAYVIREERRLRREAGRPRSPSGTA
ncbi:MAG: SURF1 family protein [Pigmentiphaga sp.]|nr:SURF1 family protein [Pigmentiphaga sp.]